jgi:hypothetical protein
MTGPELFAEFQRSQVERWAGGRLAAIGPDRPRLLAE